MDGYDYYWLQRNKDFRPRRPYAALQLSRTRLRPKLSNPDYLILAKRASYFERCITRIKSPNLRVLDVGGRLQPYRPLLAGRTQSYVAIDPQLDGLADVIGVAEQLPFGNLEFDLVICTQVLSYVDDPMKAVSEMHRVLKKGGFLFLSVPANCPQFHDERWRFLRDGVESLLSGFAAVEIVAETHSFGGAIRVINKCVEQAHSKLGQRVAAKAFFPLMNRLGRRLDDRVVSNEFLASNYSAFAQK